MTVTVRAEREGEHAHLVPEGPFDLAHAMEVASAVEGARPSLVGCLSVDVDLANLDRIDGAGAALLARLLDRLDEDGCRTHVLEEHHADTAHLIKLYRRRGVEHSGKVRMSMLTHIGAAAAELPAMLTQALDFAGRCTVAVPKTFATPRSVQWRSLPLLIREIGADGLPVACAANLLVGLIIGFVGVSQLQRFGSVGRVPELVVVAHFQELGPLVTALVVAGRSGAGLASELATMTVSEEIDALRSLGFDPMRWLVVPRCLALAAVVPFMTWIGDGLALVGGFLATEAITNMTPHAYILSTGDAITAGNLFGGLVKSPFLAMAIGLIACGQGLATRGGAAAVGARTTAAVVLAMFAVIVIDALFTLFYALLGI